MIADRLGNRSGPIVRVAQSATLLLVGDTMPWANILTRTVIPNDEPNRAPKDKVLVGRGGRPLSPRTAARWITGGIAKAGLESVATGTGVRGRPATTCTHHWLQSGLNENAVSSWLGHSNPTVTLNMYLVLAPDTLGDIREVP